MSEGAAEKEEKSRKFQAIRGTRDLLPPETALWNRVEQIAHEVFATYGYGEIRLPIFEPTELFARSIGVETDTIVKEMFTFLDPFDPLRLAKKVKEWEEHKLLGDDAGTLSTAQVAERARAAFYEALLRAGREDQTTKPRQRGRYGDLRSALLEVQPSPDQFLSLRPEATAGICRAYIEHNMQQLPQPVRLYCIGPMFRRERPQKGRYRQFYQIDAEVLGGSDAPAIDAEVIEMVMAFFEKLELQGVQLAINSIGDKNCRPKYVELLRAELLEVKDKLGADSQRRIETNPLRVLDSKLESEQKIIEKLPRIADHLCKDCAEHYAAVKRELHLRGVKYQENWRLVRGLDYYMRTTFEITARGLGSQDAVCGGGRYDGLVELLGGPPTKGIGFAIGEDRLILSLQSGLTLTERITADEQRGADVYIAWMGEKAHATAIRAAKNLRNAGFGVELPPVEQKFGKALGQADKLGARYALILGDNEVSSGEWTLKTLADGTQRKLSESQLLDFLGKKRNGK